MKLLIPCLLIFSVFTSCSKNERIKPHAYLNLKVEGSDEEFVWEQIEGELTSKEAKLYAVSDKLLQFYLNLSNINDTGLVASVSIKEISFTDEIFFRPNKVSNGYIRITGNTRGKLTGEFEVELESDLNLIEKRRIKGNFGIVNNF